MRHKESGGGEIAPEVKLDELRTIYEMIPTRYTSDKDHLSPLEKLQKDFLVVEQRKKSEFKSLLYNRLKNLLFTSELSHIGQEFLLQEFEYIYAVGRPDSIKEDEELSFFRIALDDSRYSASVFSIQGAIHFEKIAYSYVESWVIDHEEYLPREEKGESELQEIAMKKNLLKQWRESFHARFEGASLYD